MVLAGQKNSAGHQGGAEETFPKQRDVLGGCASGAWPAWLAEWHGHTSTFVLGHWSSPKRIWFKWSLKWAWSGSGVSGPSAFPERYFSHECSQSVSGCQSGMGRYPHVLGPRWGWCQLSPWGWAGKFLTSLEPPFCCTVTAKNLQEPPPREYRNIAPLQLVLPPPQPLLEYQAFGLSRDSN